MYFEQRVQETAITLSKELTQEHSPLGVWNIPPVGIRLAIPEGMGNRSRRGGGAYSE